jgi:hypothetical protein
MLRSLSTEQAGPTGPGVVPTGTTNGGSKTVLQYRNEDETSTKQSRDDKLPNSEGDEQSLGNPYSNTHNTKDCQIERQRVKAQREKERLIRVLQMVDLKPYFSMEMKMRHLLSRVEMTSYQILRVMNKVLAIPTPTPTTLKIVK